VLELTPKAYAERLRVREKGLARDGATEAAA
jgi:hypothetical protein